VGLWYVFMSHPDYVTWADATLGVDLEKMQKYVAEQKGLTEKREL